MGKKLIIQDELNCGQKYRALFENAPVGIAIIDRNRKIIESNKTLRKIIRIDTDNTGTSDLKKRKYLHADGREFTSAEIPSIISINEGIAVNDVEVAISEDDNILCWVSVSSAPVEIPDRCAVVISKDISENKRLQLRLKSSEEKFRSFFESNIDAMLISSPDGVIYSANPAACKMFGRTEEEICRAGRDGLTDPGDPRILEAIAERERNGKFYGELTLVRKDGERFPVELSATTYHDENGVIILGLILREITTRKKAEALTKQSESDYRSLFENSLMGISQVKADGKFIRINDAYAKMYGYADSVSMLKARAGVNSNFFSNRSDRKKVLEEVEKLGFVSPREFELNRVDGSKFWALVSVKKIFDKNKKLLYYQAEHIDITSQKKIEEKWKESEEKYRSLSDQSGLGIGLFSPEGEILYFNKKAISNLGNPSYNFLGKSLFDIFEKDIARRYINRFREVISSDSSKDYEDFFESPTGKYWFLSNHSKIRNSKGELIGIQVIAHDITSQKQTEKMLRELTDELRDLTHHFGENIEKERSSIARDLHDDLGQKLTALNMDISWLKSRIGVQSRPVEKKFQQVQTLINETIESVQRISYGLRPSILDNLGLKSATEWQLKDFSRFTGIKVTWVIDLPDDKTDNKVSLVIFRVIQEALTNVIRHAKATSVKVKIKAIGKTIHAIISDNGKGITQEMIDSKKSFGLMGMRERVQAFGGKIKISGKPGKGTEIFVKMPFAE